MKFAKGTTREEIGMIGNHISSWEYMRAIVGASPRLIQPTYAQANVGHPSTTDDSIQDRRLRSYPFLSLPIRSDLFRFVQMP
jgi:hypothetical protein